MTRRAGNHGRRAYNLNTARAVKVWVCGGCGLQHPPKSHQCTSCGRMDWLKFDSKGEAARWANLELQVSQGLIDRLQRQVRFELKAWVEGGGAVVVGHYFADFMYFRDGVRVIEDYKPGKDRMTDVARLKLRWMDAMGQPVTVTSA